MTDSVRLAGLVASHAILCVSRSQSLTTPLVVFEKDDGATQFIEVQGASSQDAVARAGRLLRDPAPGVLRAVLAFEAFFNLPSGQMDAIFLQALQYQPEPKKLLLAVPFRPAQLTRGFAVFRPKFITTEAEGVPPEVLAAFLHGTSLHPPGHAVWMRHLDESR